MHTLKNFCNKDMWSFCLLTSCFKQRYLYYVRYQSYSFFFIWSFLETNHLDYMFSFVLAHTFKELVSCTLHCFGLLSTADGRCCSNIYFAWKPDLGEEVVLNNFTMLDSRHHRMNLHWMCINTWFCWRAGEKGRKSQ